MCSNAVHFGPLKEKTILLSQRPGVHYHAINISEPYNAVVLLLLPLRDEVPF